MANNYTLFSVFVPTTKPEELEWVREVTKFDYEGMDNDKYDDLVRGMGLNPDHVREFLRDHLVFPDVTIEVDADGFYLYSEESGNTDHAIAILSAFLRKFAPDNAIGFEAAFTCSKPRPGEFGGVAVFVTANGAEWMSTGDWLFRKQRDFAEAARLNKVEELSKKGKK